MKQVKTHFREVVFFLMLALLVSLLPEGMKAWAAERPAMPEVKTVREGSIYIKGNAEVKGTVYVRYNNKIYKSSVLKNGTFKVKTPALKKGKSVKVYVIKDKVKSKVRTITVKGKTVLSSLPAHVRRSYQKYEKDGWKGLREDQTPGTKAGGTYWNMDKQLPETDSQGNPVTYREFDVNNKIEGQGRDAERFVVGSDGSRYYTKDHYETFIKIK